MNSTRLLVAISILCSAQEISADVVDVSSLKPQVQRVWDITPLYPSLGVHLAQVRFVRANDRHLLDERIYWMDGAKRFRPLTADPKAIGEFVKSVGGVLEDRQKRCDFASLIAKVILGSQTRLVDDYRYREIIDKRMFLVQQKTLARLRSVPVTKRMIRFACWSPSNKIWVVSLRFDNDLSVQEIGIDTLSEEDDQAND